jgi:hypothetical protein
VEVSDMRQVFEMFDNLCRWKNNTGDILSSIDFIFTSCFGTNDPAEKD